MSALFLPRGVPMYSKAVSGGWVVMLRHPITPNLVLHLDAETEEDAKDLSQLLKNHLGRLAFHVKDDSE